MNDLLWEGINLMAIGMGAVFAFLVLLVYATSAMSYLLNRYFPQPETPVVPQTPSSAQQTQVQDGQLMAVIAAAIHRYRSRQK